MTKPHLNIKHMFQFWNLPDSKFASKHDTYTKNHIKEHVGLDVEVECWHEFRNHHYEEKFCRVLFRFKTMQDLNYFKLLTMDDYYYSKLAIGQEIVFDRYAK